MILSQKSLFKLIFQNEFKKKDKLYCLRKLK
jgi:hypothetical protein